MSPPFQYQPVQYPMAGVIPQLMEQGGQIQANALLQAAQARAQGQIGAAQAWGQGLQNIGNMVTNVAEKYPEMQINQFKLQQAQLAQKYTKQMNTVMQGLVGPNGEPPDAEVAQGLLTKAGIPFDVQQPMIKSLTEIGDRHKENYADAANWLFRGLQQLPADATPDQVNQTIVATLGIAGAAKAISAEDQAKIGQALAANPGLTRAQAMGLALGWMGGSPSKRFESTIQDFTKPIVLAGARPGGTPAQAVSPLTNQPIATGAQPPPAPKHYEAKEGTINGKPVMVNFDPATGKNYDQETGEEVHGFVGKTAAGGQTPPEQYQAAIAAGDLPRAKVILQGIRDVAAATRDPTLEAINAQLRRLDVQLAEQRLAAGGEAGTKRQDQLEDRYRTDIRMRLGQRGGGLGAEDLRVLNVNHALSLMEQTYDPRTNEWNPSTTQVNELATALANAIAPQSRGGIQLQNEIKQGTFKGDLAKAATYIFGTPFTGSTQAVMKMYWDSLQRQGATSVQNRENEMKVTRGLYSDLDPARRAKLDAVELAPLRKQKVVHDPATGATRLYVSVDNGRTWQIQPLPQ